MDLLSVIAHELGHAAGLDHEDAGVMDDALAAGERTIAGPEPAGVRRDLLAAEPNVPVPGQPEPMLVWENPLFAAAPLVHSAPSAKPQWMDDFLNHLGKTEQERNPNASLRIHVPFAMKPAADLHPQLGSTRR